MDESKKMLEEEIKAEIQRLSSLTPGSKERTAAIDELSKLYHLKIDEVKSLEDVKVKNNQMSEQAKDRYFKLAMETANLVIPLVFYATWMKRGFKFEETGTFTSTTFRGLFNRFKPTKK